MVSYFGVPDRIPGFQHRRYLFASAAHAAIAVRAAAAPFLSIMTTVYNTDVLAKESFGRKVARGTADQGCTLSAQKSDPLRYRRSTKVLRQAPAPTLALIVSRVGRGGSLIPRSAMIVSARPRVPASSRSLSLAYRYSGRSEEAPYLGRTHSRGPKGPKPPE